MVKMHPSNLSGLRKPGSLFTASGQVRCVGERSVAEFQSSLQPHQSLQNQNNDQVISLVGLMIGNRFQIIGEKAIGSGSGGEVWEAIDLKTNQNIALKKINQKRFKEKVRETDISNDNTISSNNLFVAPLDAIIDSRFQDTLFISTPLRKEGDLRNLLFYHGSFRIKTARSALADLLISLDFLHSKKNIIHRDVKPENIYWDGKTCRLGDFGLARRLNQSAQNEELLTPQMVTLWYRAPEILLGSQIYNTKVDIFSVGAVFGELLIGKPIFKGHSEIDQIKLIFDLLGLPIANQKGWPSDIISTFETFTIPESSGGGGGGGEKIKKDRWARLADKMPFGTPVSALDLMFKLMSINPSHRPSARDALLHPFFWEEPKVAQWRNTGAASQTNVVGSFNQIQKSKSGAAAEEDDEDDDEDDKSNDDKHNDEEEEEFDEDELPPSAPPLLYSESSGNTMKDITKQSSTPLSSLNLNSQYYAPSSSSSSSSFSSKFPSANIPMEKSTILSKKPRMKLGGKLRRHSAHLRPYVVFPKEKMTKNL